MNHADISVTRLARSLLDPLEFEFVDFDTARRALEEPPAGVKPRAVIDWATQRSPMSEADRLLAEATRLWAESLPAAHRPHHLLDEYPRVANRISRVWDHPAACQNVLDELIVDRRGGRRGFPRAVADEIESLRDLQPGH